MDIDWRWHPITRVIAGLLGVLLIAVSLACVIIAVTGLRLRDWPAAATVVVAIPGVVLAQLLLIGAWTGAEPAVRCYDEEEDGPHDHVV